MKANQLKWGALLSYFQMGLGILISLLYTPVMLRLLGQSEYGLYNTVASTISVLSLLNLGFKSGYVRYFAKYKKNKDEQSISKLNGLFLCIFLVIGFIALVCGLFLSFNLDIVFAQGISPQEYKIAKVLMILLTINLATSFPMSVFSNIISSNERYIFLKLLGIIKTVISPMVTLPLLLMGFGSIALVSVTLFFSLFTDVLYMYYVFVVLKNKFVFHDFEKGLFKEMCTYTSFVAINMVIDQVNWNIDKILLGRFIGTTEVAIYSVGYSLYNYYMQFSTSISAVFTPKIHRIINETKNELKLQREILTELFTKVGRIQFILLALLASGVVFFGKTFITVYWAGQEYSQSYYVAVILIISASIALIQNLGIEIQRAENKHQFRTVAYAVMAIINFVLSVVLCQRYGAVGSVIGTAISLVLANGIVMNIYYHKRCNIDIISFWKSISRLALGLILPVAAGIGICALVEIKTILSFLACIVIYVLIYGVSMYFIGMNDYEKELFGKALKKMGKRNNDRT